MRALRARQQRNLLATLLLSQGVPMLLGGDELGRTQHGNNNAWCHDSELSWLDWDLDDGEEELLAFTRRLIALRRAHPVFRRPRFLEGGNGEGPSLPDAWWFRADGRPMTERDWQDHDARVLGLFLNGRAIPERGIQGERIVDDSFLVLVNGHHDDVKFTLPAVRFGRRWSLAITTAEPGAADGAWAADASGEVTTAARSVTVLRRTDD